MESNADTVFLQCWNMFHSGMTSFRFHSIPWFFTTFYVKNVCIGMTKSSGFSYNHRIEIIDPERNLTARLFQLRVNDGRVHSSTKWTKDFNVWQTSEYSERNANEFVFRTF